MTGVVKSIKLLSIAKMCFVCEFQIIVAELIFRGVAVTAFLNNKTTIMIRRL